jgi:hypothetical protein
MRLSRLHTHHRFVHRLKLAVVRWVSGRPPTDVVLLQLYRYDFFGRHLSRMLSQALRGPSEWSVFERELMAAFVSSLNRCVF